jgi:nucleolar protein TMA23
MDAHALLTSQGWRGTGHSLHPTNDGTGLRRPLLVSQKQNTLGVGKKQHRTSDMWWQNAFDKSLKGLDTSVAGKVIQTVSNGGLDMVAKGGGKFVGTGGLYSCFVRGEVLGGTLEEREEMNRMVGGDKEEESDSASTSTAKKSRKSEGDTKEARRARKEAKRMKRAAAAGGVVETKEQRRERRQLKKLLRLKK